MGFPGSASSKGPARQCLRHRRQAGPLVWEDALEERMAAHSSSLAWRIPWTEELGTVHGVAKSQTQLSNLAHIHEEL